MLRHFLLLCLLPVCAATAMTEQEIQAAIDAAIKAGGGEVVIPPGVHRITHGLLVKDAKKLRIIGLDTERCVLQLPPLAVAETTAEAAAGSTRLATQRQQNIVIGMRLRIEADGELEAFTHKPKPYQLAIVKSVEPDALVLEAALKFPVPATTLIRHEDAPNVFELRGACDDVRIEKLTLDGGRLASDVLVRGHAQLCGVMAQGAYTYEKGPTAARLKDIAISRCIIQHCHGRGVAFYSVEGGLVEDCTLMDTNDEAVDLDHFTIQSVVRHNHIARCSVAVELNDANECEVRGNECRECGIGISLWRWCKLPNLNEGHHIIGNSFESMTGNGFQIGTGTANNVFEDNDITGSGRNGISLMGKAQVLKNNRVSNSKLKDLKITEDGALAK